MTYYPITGTLRETSEQASPYSYFSLTRRFGLREMWDDEHAAFYGKAKKHDVADYIKPLGLVLDNGGNQYVRCCFVDQLGIEHIADIDRRVAADDPKFVAQVLKALYGFNVYSNLHDVFGKALNVLRLEPEEAQASEEDSADDASSDSGVSIYETADGYPLTGGFLYETHEYNYIDFYHIVDPLTMRDGIPAGAQTSTADSSEDGGDEGGDASGETEEGDASGNDSVTEEGGEQTGTGNADDNDASAGDAQAAIPQPEIVIHDGYNIRVTARIRMQLSEEEE